jgi:L-alanine-DL-glutamate epimerase-like enolase superfamily enzyme
MAPRIHRVTSLKLYFIPVKTRVPLKFGPETLSSVTCLRVAMGVVDENNRCFEGWGETPLSVQWVWPSRLPYARRHDALERFCRELAAAWMRFSSEGHPIEIGHDFQEHLLPQLLSEFNARDISRSEQLRPERELPPENGLRRAEPDRVGLTNLRPVEPMPWLAALVCNSAFDIALHDAFGRLVGRPVYETYGPAFLTGDLTQFLEPAAGSSVSFLGRYPTDYLLADPARQLLAWHLVGGLDPLGDRQLTGAEPRDGHPVLLADWIRRDGLKCLKVKLRGTDSAWDYQRLVGVGQIALPLGIEWLTADFNCTVKEPSYVNEILDELRKDHPQIHDRLLYVEQPFPYDLERHPLDVHTLSDRKPLFLDESAHDWKMIRLGRELGWTGVALKTCKTQTGAILSACWARAHRMQLMVQDLTNPMLAQIPHLLLAANVGTIKGVETNSMQFYPEASAPESKVHPGIYQRRQGMVDLASIRGPGFGYRLEEIERQLPEPALVV